MCQGNRHKPELSRVKRHWVTFGEKGTDESGGTHSKGNIHGVVSSQSVWRTKAFSSVQFSRSVRSDSATPWTAACQAFLSITSSWNLLKLVSIELVIPSYHLILCHPLLLPPSILLSSRVFSNESVLCIRWQKQSSFSFSISWRIEAGFLGG